MKLRLNYSFPQHRYRTIREERITYPVVSPGPNKMSDGRDGGRKMKRIDNSLGVDICFHNFDIASTYRLMAFVPHHLLVHGEQRESTRQMSIFQPAPPPPTKLGVLRVLSPNAGVHVSPFCLGAMSVGDKWNGIMGSMDKESSFKLLDAIFRYGRQLYRHRRITSDYPRLFPDYTPTNFSDFFSQDESSEQFIGEWMEKRASNTYISRDFPFSTPQTSSAETTRLHRRPTIPETILESMHVSVEASLKKLRTSYIDLLYVHWWDYDTSDQHAYGLAAYACECKERSSIWVFLTLLRSKTPFVVYQGLWNVLDRSFERDILPMARSLGLALAPWNILGAGKFRTDAEEQRRKESGENGRTMLSQDWQRTEAEMKLSCALKKVASEVGLGENITAVAIAYVMYKTLMGKLEAEKSNISKQTCRRWISYSPRNRSSSSKVFFPSIQDSLTICLVME
ncbi:Aldo/keto reductase [Gymnopus androsaceus JB14]|uniref:Aldo/keto reductase n=1 Tax=Gymnopus androsaceus JB14 TaxID=1447944 RepID=A0A6A4GTA6_9AGAR|nr:Aldo/keto reductase [Gymnopus androsaceus JB14]